MRGNKKLVTDKKEIVIFDTYLLIRTLLKELDLF